MLSILLSIFLDLKYLLAQFPFLDFFSPMRYHPEYEEIVIEPVTTANKNILSYFMRTDKSYYTKPEYVFPLYNTELPYLRIVVNNGEIAIEADGLEFSIKQIDSIIQNKYNIEKYGTKTHCMDKLYLAIYNFINEINDKLINNNLLRIEPSKMFVQIIFCDFFNRSLILSIIDVLLKELRFKAIMLLPLSLALSIGKNINNGSFVFNDGFAFVDDFVRVDAYVPGEEEVIVADDQDFVEEFTRLQLLDSSTRYSCDSCEHKEELEDKMKAHVEKEHSEAGYSLYSTGGSIKDEFWSRLRYLFGKEKGKRISENLYAIGTEFEGAEVLEDYYAIAITGARRFAALECSKETWLTDIEWNEWRLRLLKEKVLFYI